MQHYELRILHKLTKIKKNLYELYLNQILRQIAFSLIGIFIPIYLFSLGFSLITAMFYMVIYWISVGAFSLFSAFISPKFGLKYTISITTLFYVLYFLLIMFIKPTTPVEIIYLIGIMGGFTQALYWIPLHSEFIKNSHRIHEGKEAGTFIALPTIVGIFIPLIGGVILKVLGFDILSILVIVIILLSGVPLLFGKDYKGFNFHKKDVKLMVSKLSAPYFLFGSASMFSRLIWPFFIYTTLTDFVIVGGSATINGMGVVLLTIIAGRLSDKISKHKMIKLGAILYSLVWIGRIFATSQIDIMILSFLSGIFFTLMNVPLYVDFCNYAKKRNILGSAMSREVWLTLGKITPLLILIPILSLVTTEFFFDIAFGVAAILSFMFILLKIEDY